MIKYLIYLVSEGIDSLFHMIYINIPFDNDFGWFFVRVIARIRYSIAKFVVDYFFKDDIVIKASLIHAKNWVEEVLSTPYPSKQSE